MTVHYIRTACNQRIGPKYRYRNFEYRTTGIRVRFTFTVLLT